MSHFCTVAEAPLFMSIRKISQFLSVMFQDTIHKVVFFFALLRFITLYFSLFVWASILKFFFTKLLFPIKFDIHSKHWQSALPTIVFDLSRLATRRLPIFHNVISDLFSIGLYDIFV